MRFFMCIRSFQFAAVILLSASFAISFAATSSVQNEEWSPVQTASGPVPFAPEFSGRYSEENRKEVLSHISAIHKSSHTRNNQDRVESGGSPFASMAKIASVSIDDAQ
jgi:hypothetical protein